MDKRVTDPSLTIMVSLIDSRFISYIYIGARLTHNHERQYYYALQSLTLWREIANDMFKLWYLSEEDLLSTVSPYRLRDTGNSISHVQIFDDHAPTVRIFRPGPQSCPAGSASKASDAYAVVQLPRKDRTLVRFHPPLTNCLELGSPVDHHRVGSSVIHLGDHNVPNALMFIDKYTQVCA